jgi:predicted RNA binding protein YcfA (HicA-like mRNA interferase family)
MSRKLPVVNGADLIRAFQRAGWIRLRQTGSHVRMQNGGEHVTIPLHKPLRRGTLAALIDTAGMTREGLPDEKGVTMTGAIAALVLAATAPDYTNGDIRSFPCGAMRISIHAPPADRMSTAVISHGILTVSFAGAKGRRTVFLIVDRGAEQKIRGLGRITVEQRVAKHRLHEIVLGTLYNDGIIFGTKLCVRS